MTRWVYHVQGDYAQLEATPIEAVLAEADPPRLAPRMRGETSRTDLTRSLSENNL